jgi:drug/metabolite transporter (DMT)-like permease
MGWLEPYGGVLFLFGGMLVAGSLTINVLIRFGGMAIPETLGLILTLAGFVAGLVGCIALYPRVNRQNPRLARGCLAVAGGAIVGLITLLGWALATAVIPLSDPSPILALTTLLLMLSAYALFGLAVIRTNAVGGSVGYMLLGLVVVFVIVFLRSILIGGDPSDLFTLVSELAETSLLLATGARLQGRPSPTRREDSSPA